MMNGILLMLASSVSFAVMAAAAKLVSENVPVAEIILIRSVLGSAAVAFMILKSNTSWIGKEPRILIARGVVGFTAMVLYFWCLSKIDLGTAVMLNYTAPISAVVCAHLFFREKLGAFVKTAAAFAFLGVYFLTKPQFHLNPLPILVGLVSGLLVGTVHVLIRYSHEDETPLTIIFYFTVISTLGAGFLTLRSGFTVPSAADSLWLLIVTVTSLAGQLTMTHSLRAAPVSVVSPFGYATPVFGLLLGWLVWGESLSRLSLLGCAIIVACGIALYRYHTSI